MSAMAARPRRVPRNGVTDEYRLGEEGGRSDHAGGGCGRPGPHDGAGRAPPPNAARMARTRPRRRAGGRGQRRDRHAVQPAGAEVGGDVHEHDDGALARAEQRAQRRARGRRRGRAGRGRARRRAGRCGARPGRPGGRRDGEGAASARTPAPGCPGRPARRQSPGRPGSPTGCRLTPARCPACRSSPGSSDGMTRRGGQEQSLARPDHDRERNQDLRAGRAGAAAASARAASASARSDIGGQHHRLRPPAVAGVAAKGIAAVRGIPYAASTVASRTRAAVGGQHVPGQGDGVAGVARGSRRPDRSTSSRKGRCRSGDRARGRRGRRHRRHSAWPAPGRPAAGLRQVDREGEEQRLHRQGAGRTPGRVVSGPRTGASAQQVVQLTVELLQLFRGQVEQELAVPAASRHCGG